MPFAQPPEPTAEEWVAGVFEERAFPQRLRAAGFTEAADALEPDQAVIDAAFGWPEPG